MLLKACKTLRFDGPDEKLVEDWGKWDCFDYAFIDSSIQPSETCTQTSIDTYMSEKDC